MDVTETDGTRWQQKTRKPFQAAGFCTSLDFFNLKNGAEDETRTRTSVAHYPLKIACLPIPPLRHSKVCNSQEALFIFGSLGCWRLI
jgi:hypothetical protein